MIAALIALAVMALLAPHLCTLIGSCLGDTVRKLPEPSPYDTAQEEGKEPYSHE